MIFVFGHTKIERCWFNQSQQCPVWEVPQIFQNDEFKTTPLIIREVNKLCTIVDILGWTPLSIENNRYVTNLLWSLIRHASLDTPTHMSATTVKITYTHIKKLYMCPDKAMVMHELSHECIHMHIYMHIHARTLRSIASIASTTELVHQ